MSKFTPGPWVVFKVKKPTGITIGFGPYPGERWIGRLAEHLDIDLDEDLANANLLAAAPDLYAALVKTRGQWIDSVNKHDCLKAIAKAEGRE